VTSRCGGEHPYCTASWLGSILGSHTRCTPPHKWLLQLQLLVALMEANQKTREVRVLVELLQQRGANSPPS
jgi:hypothetical protein